MSPNPALLPDGLTASKLIAVHVNFRSRAEQRGRTVRNPSYFLKAPSTLAGDGEVVRPRGVELLAFEGEIAVIISSTARGLTPAQAHDAIGWVAPANDFGVYDLRWAVLLNVVAVDSAGKPVPDLKASEFAVFDNGSPQQIASVRLNQSDKPGPLVVLFDLIGSEQRGRLK